MKVAIFVVLIENVMEIYQASIDKNAVAELPQATYDGPVIVVDADALPAEVEEHLMSQKIVGFDTETRPSFNKGEKHQVALVQLACEDVCYLIRLNGKPFPEMLARLFHSESVCKIGLSTRDDFMRMRAVFPSFRPRNVMELQSYVNGFGITDMSLQKIYAIVFGERISKSQQLSNWEAETLSPAQQQYAALDAVATRRIYLKLSGMEYGSDVKQIGGDAVGDE